MCWRDRIIPPSIDCWCILGGYFLARHWALWYHQLAKQINQYAACIPLALWADLVLWVLGHNWSYIYLLSWFNNVGKKSQKCHTTWYQYKLYETYLTFNFNTLDFCYQLLQTCHHLSGYNIYIIFYIWKEVSVRRRWVGQMSLYYYYGIL